MLLFIFAHDESRCRSPVQLLGGLVALYASIQLAFTARGVTSPRAAPRKPPWTPTPLFRFQ